MPYSRVHAAARSFATTVVRAAVLCFCSLLITLTACAQTTALSGVGVSSTTITPNGDGQNDSTTISYTIGQPSQVSIYIQDGAGKRYALREAVERLPADEPYSLRFDGTVPGEAPPFVQRVLPDGDYFYFVEATPTDGGPAIPQSGKIAIRDAATKAPVVEGLKVFPQVVTPNEDAIDDVANFSYRLPITSTVTINITNGRETVPFITGLDEGPFEQSHIWDGKRTDGSLLPTGLYTYTVQAADRAGNIVRQAGTLRLEKPGRAEAHITYVDIAPVEVALGNVITVTVRVKNTGDVPIRTQGPAPGHRYNTNEIFSSIEGQKWAEKGGGYWRVGADWGGGHGYPFRWAITSRPPEQWKEPGIADELAPGEEVTITGTVEIRQREDKMYFYAGLIHEGVGYPEHRKGYTLVKVGF